MHNPPMRNKTLELTMLSRPMKNCKLVPLPTPTIVLKGFWLDVVWEEQHYNHPLSQFHGPGGWWHCRGDTSKECLFSYWAWLMGSTKMTIHFHSLWVNIYALPRQLLRYSQVGFWWTAMIIVIFTTVLSLELFSTANLRYTKHRGHPF